VQTVFRILQALVLLVVIAGVNRTVGQEKPASLPRPLYLLPRYEEDWSLLSDPAKRGDFWDPIKFIPLNEDRNAFLSLGGEVRETYERFHNTNFGLSPDDPDGYLLQRYLFHVDFHAGQRFRFFGELNSSLEDGRTGGPRPLDEDKLDLHQGFVDFVVLKPRENSSLTLRIGRQEMAFGSGRMIDLVEGPNVPLSFDGFRLSWKSPEWKVDGFATRPVKNEPGFFDDPPQHGFAFWGLYATHPLGQTQRKTLDFYYLGLDLKPAVFNQGSGHEKRQTLGARVWGEHGPWAYGAEAMYQFGSFGLGTINAWRVAADSRYSFSSVRWRPRIGLATDFASGDKNPANPDLQTFNSLFQSGTYSGRANVLGPDNAIRLEPSLGLVFSERLTLSAGWGFFWRESSNDGLYGIPGNLIVPSNGVKSRYEGSRPIAQLDWQMTRHLSTHVNYIYVFNASFEEQSSHATTSMSYISPWLTYRF
jgi:hypothetical protein